MKRFLSFFTTPHHIPLIVVGLLAVVLSGGLVLTLLQHDAPAASGNIYLHDSKLSGTKGQDVRFILRITPGAQIDTVTATATYDTNKLTFKKAEYTDTPFSSQIPATVKDGSVTVQSAKLGGQIVEDDALIATLVFTANTSGSQALTLTDGNAARAGTATYPTVDGKIIEHSSTVTKAAAEAETTSAEGTTDNSPLAVAASPIAAALRALGVSKATAQRAAPWIGGLVVCAIIAATVVILLILRKQRQAPTVDNHKGVDHADTTNS